jgi:hypothetical protein
MLLPSTVYDYDNKHFRLGFGRENMPEALDKFRDFLNELIETFPAQNPAG